MVFFKIDDSNSDSEKIKEFKKLFESKNVHHFVLVYMDGCGPCNETKPEWHKLENVLNKYANDPTISIVSINKDVLEKMNLSGLPNPSAFPTIVHIKDKKTENYEDAKDLETDRTIDSFTKWIEQKVKKMEDTGETKRLQEGGQKTRIRQRIKKTRIRQKGGIFIDHSDPDAFKHFLQNSSIEVLSKGSFGITLQAILNDGATTTYKYLNERYFGQPVECLLIKLSCLHNESNGEMSKKLEIYNGNVESTLKTTDIEQFKNEINVQQEIYFKTCDYLQPICPAIVYANTFNTEDSLHEIFNLLLTNLHEEDEQWLHSIVDNYEDGEFTSLGIIGMEFAEDYQELFRFKNTANHQEKQYISLLCFYTIIELAITTGYNHGDFHASNIMINFQPNVYFQGLPGQVLLIDYGFAKKIPPPIMEEIQGLYLRGEYMDILEKLCEFPYYQKQIKDRVMFKWICDRRSQPDKDKINQYIKNQLIPRRELFKRSIVKKFNALSASRPAEYPTVPLPVEIKELLLHQGFKGGRNKEKNRKTQKKRRWSQKYKRTINCRRPKGFSQKQYCKYGRK